MNRIVPGKTNQKLPIILKFNIFDIIYILVGLAVIIATLLTMMAFNVKPFAIIAGVVVSEAVIFLILLAQITEYRLYWYIRHLILFIFSKKKYAESTLENQLGVSFKDNYVSTEAGIYSKVIEIKGIDFSLISEATQDLKINQLAVVLGNIDKGKIVKLDKPISFLDKLEDVDKRLIAFTEEYDKLSDEEKKDPNNLNARQLEARITALTIDHNVFMSAEESKTIKSNSYFLVLYNENLGNLNIEVERAIRLLNNMGLFSYELDSREIKQFYATFFDTEENKDGKLIFPQTTEKSRYLIQNNKKVCVHTLCDLPYVLGNGWLSDIANIEGVKLVVNFKNCSNLAKATKNINKKIVSLGALLLQKQTESDRMEINAQIEGFRHLLEQLKFSKETLHTCDIMLIYEYDKKTIKNINSILKSTCNARLDALTFRQMEVFINAFPHLQSKNVKYMQRDFQSSTFAGSFPFISDLFIDKKGDFIGENSGPVFFDMWQNLNGGPGTRTNANMMTIGASGKGKSYLQKILIKNQLARDTKIFILDPENEYSYIANEFGGEVIDVVGGEMRINPFELIPEMDESGNVSSGFGLLSQHLAFLGSFFKVVLPYLTDFTRQVLQNELKTIYANKGIYPVGYKNPKDKNAKVVLFKDANLKPEDFPTFTDVINYFNKMPLEGKTTQVVESIVELQAFLKDFENDKDGQGRYGILWNGPTTISLDNDFVVFNFRGLDNGSSDEIKNGQMLLITKYLNREIINNYEINLHVKKDEAKKVVLLVDEAHNFIDPEFPVALDMMKNMAKRIRKYSGSLWVATQNIADFVGFDINTKTKATAVINNCQYTVLFGLKPNDIEQVKEMYAKASAGALTEEEINYLATAGQGDALLMIDTSTRISFHVTLKDRTNETPLILPVEYSSEDDKNVSEGEVAEEVIQNAQENQEKVTSEV